MKSYQKVFLVVEIAMVLVGGVFPLYAMNTFSVKTIEDPGVDYAIDSAGKTRSYVPPKPQYRYPTDKTEQLLYLLSLGHSDFKKSEDEPGVYIAAPTRSPLGRAPFITYQDLSDDAFQTKLNELLSDKDVDPDKIMIVYANNDARKIKQTLLMRTIDRFHSMS